MKCSSPSDIRRGSLGIVAGLLLAGLPFAGFPLPTATAQAVTPCLETGLSSLYAQTSPAVVSVVSHRSEYARDEDAPEHRRLVSLHRLVATGVIVDAGGCLVTTDRVAQAGDSVVAYFPDGRRMNAKYIGGNASIHVTLLQLEGPRPFPCLHAGPKLSMSSLPEWLAAVAYGPWQGKSPGRPSLTLSRKDGVEAARIPCGDSLETIWRIRAPFHPGNSGGVVVTLEGDWIGLVTGVLASPGRPQVVPVGDASDAVYDAGLVVPADLVSRAVQQIRSCGAPAPAPLGFLGVSTFRPGTAQGSAADAELGVVVSEVLRGSPAESAGILRGDVILRFGQMPVAGVMELTRAVAETAPGTLLVIDLLRNGTPRPVQVRIGDRGAEEAAIARQTRANAERVALLREIERAATRLDELRKELHKREADESSSAGQPHSSGRNPG